MGICGFDRASGWIDGPPVIPELRGSDRFTELVQAACAEIASRPIMLETRGNSEETLVAYERAGFHLVEDVRGWELRLRGS